jgi:hypothetical protein
MKLATTIALIVVLILVAYHWSNYKNGMIRSKVVEVNPHEDTMQQAEMTPSMINNEGGRTLFDVWSSEEERIRFVKVALSFLGTPYRKGGSNALGMDCSGFVMAVYRLFDITLPRTVNKLYVIGKIVERSQLEIGDVVFFNGPNKPAHCGIYLGDGEFIHASSTAGLVRKDSMNRTWGHRHYVGAVRIKEMAAP